MITFESILGQPVSREAFHGLVQKRLVHQVHAVRRQAERINREFPQMKSDILREADLAMQGMLVMPGSLRKPYFVGNPPRWHENPLNDNEYLWLLNRMSHWTTLLRAFSLTGEGKYAQKVVEELRDWIAACPRPSMDALDRLPWVSPWRVCEVGLRMAFTWPPVISHLLDTEFLSPDLLAQFAASVFEHGEFLCVVSPYHHPKSNNNHHQMENLGLLNLSCLFPEFSTAAKWKAQAVHELERSSAAQMTEEGGQVEGCPSYHAMCVELYVHALAAAKASGTEFSPQYMSAIQQGIDYAMRSTRPSGTLVPWGDTCPQSDRPIRVALGSHRVFGALDPLRIVMRGYGAPAMKAICIEEAWENPSATETLAAIDEAEATQDEVSLPTDSWQKSLKQVMLRTDWSRDALSVFFACRTPIGNGHAHIDPMSFDFTAYGRPLVVDPSHFTYRDDDDRRIFKSAAWHNTLVINERDPFEYLSSWDIGPQKEGNILNVLQQPGRKVIIARHDNYEPAIHFRALAMIDNAFLLVVDLVENLSPGDLLQLYFHLDSTRVALDGKTGGAETRDEGKANVRIVPCAELNGALLPGHVSDMSDTMRPSTRLRLTAPRSGETTRAFATVIAPWSALSSRPSVSAPKVGWNADRLSCEFQMNGKVHYFELPQTSSMDPSLG